MEKKVFAFLWKERYRDTERDEDDMIRNWRKTPNYNHETMPLSAFAKLKRTLNRVVLLPKFPLLLFFNFCPFLHPILPPLL